MQSLLTAIQLPSYAILLLLAGYLLARGRTHAINLTVAGVLISFALIQADQYLGGVYPNRGAWLARALWFAYPLPVALWIRAAILLLPGDTLALDRAWWALVLPFTMLLILGGWVGNDLVAFSTRDPGSLYWTYGLYSIALSLLAAGLFHYLLRRTSPTDRARRAFVWLRLAGIGYAAAMLVLIAGILPPDVVFAGVIIDVVTFGAVGIAYDAIAEGQAVRRDLAAIVLKTLAAAALLVLPWAISLIAANAWSFAAAVALLITLGGAALGVPLADEFDRLLDALLWRSAQGEQSAREALRTLMRNTARQPAAIHPVTDLDRDEFTRLTRRALSHMPNLPRLAASPLTTMQIVAERTGTDADTLQRANALRRILAECIDSLRPKDRGEYGVTDEWRFYNALYYPYVAGISPYRRDALTDSLDDDTREVVHWFQTMVPQRTMYNWQNRAAERIAMILLEREAMLAP